MFTGTDVSIYLGGRLHLGAAQDSRSFVEEYISDKIWCWSGELSSLSTIALTHPHAAYAVFSHV